MPEFILNTPLTSQERRTARLNGFTPKRRKLHPYWALSDFAKGYIEAMFFTNGDIGDERENLLNELGVDRLTHKSVAAIKRDCAAFLSHVMPDGCFVQQWLDRVSAEYDESQAGRDFWFTRQGHGVGFYDREELNRDTWAPDDDADLSGWIIADDDADLSAYHCAGNFRRLLSEAATGQGEVYPEVSRGWIHHG